MIYNYCTLFDSFYLSRGLAMYESLIKHTENFHLYIFAFDDNCYDILKKLSLTNVTVIALKDFENDDLLKIKHTRTAQEYCWTCTPSTIKYCLITFNLEQCTYLDADLYFFDNPNILIDEMGNGDVLITEHKYSLQYNYYEKMSGKYCVQFMSFKNTSKGLNVLNWWVNACNEWCYARFEDGKFGDQKYLDDWMSRFDCVYELQHIGSGIAPWNMNDYIYYKKQDKILIQSKKSNSTSNLIFFHFHAFKILENEKFANECYKIENDCKDTVYNEYIKCISRIHSSLQLRSYDKFNSNYIHINT